MEIKKVKRMKMNKKRGLLFIAVCMIILLMSKPIQGEATDGGSNGNILGMEEKCKLMKQDFMYLNEEIERLYKECE